MTSCVVLAAQHLHLLACMCPDMRAQCSLVRQTRMERRSDGTDSCRSRNGTQASWAKGIATKSARISQTARGSDEHEIRSRTARAQQHVHTERVRHKGQAGTEEIAPKGAVLWICVCCVGILQEGTSFVPYG